MHSMNSKQKIKTPLKAQLFERIESEQVCPRPRWVFASRECVVWFLWFISVVVGALAVAISLFVVTHHQYAFYEATHDNWFTFAVEVLPYIWIFIFLFMLYTAFYNLQHTKHGYRYPVWMIVSSSIVLSFAGGAALQLFGLGYSVDKVLGDHMAMYMSQEKLERKLWQAPHEGRLLGQQLLSTVVPTSTIVFKDVHGVHWRMDVSELQEQDIALLASKRSVRILGKEMNEVVPIFYACGAFPWMLDTNTSLKEMSAERKTFLEWVYRHAHRAKDRVALLEGETFASTTLNKMSVCADIAAVRRMSKGM